MKIEKNKDDKIVKQIEQLLDENKKKYGKEYCPCALLQDDAHVCKCEDFLLSDQLGECHCGLYVKTEV